MHWKWSYIELIDNFSCKLYHNSEWGIKVRLCVINKVPFTQGIKQPITLLLVEVISRLTTINSVINSYYLGGNENLQDM